MGISLILLSSSIFLKDRNPKLLEKEPFWKKAYSKAKERLKSLAPKHLPQTDPVRNYSTLEDMFN